MHFCFSICSQTLNLHAGIGLHRLHILGDVLVQSESYSANLLLGTTASLSFGERSYLRAGIFYGQLNNKTTEIDNGAEVIIQLEQDRLYFPLHYGLAIINRQVKAGFYLGPNLGYGISGYMVQSLRRNATNETVIIREFDIYSDPDLVHKRLFPKFDVGIRTDYKNFGFEIQYSIDVLLRKKEPLEYDPGKMGNEVISFLLSYSFDLSKNK